MTLNNMFQKTAFARAMAEVPLCCLDVGSRDGMEPDLLPAAFAIDAVGFELDQEECQRLNQSDSGPWRSIRYLPTALAGDTGARTLHMAQDPVSSSLLPPLQETGQRFDNTAYSTIVGTTDVDTLSLDQAVDHFHLAAPDYLKLDTEGLELEILEGAETALTTVLAIKTEVGFMNFRAGQPPARALDAFLADREFELMALISPAYWRRHGHVVHPYMGQEILPYSRGQLAHGDFLYMKHPDALPPDQPENHLKAAWLAMIYGYFDRAEEYLDHPGATSLLADQWQIGAIEALCQASRLYGRIVRRRIFVDHLRGVAAYFR